MTLVRRGETISQKLFGHESNTYPKIDLENAKFILKNDE